MVGLRSSKLSIERLNVVCTLLCGCYLRGVVELQGVQACGVGAHAHGFASPRLNSRLRGARTTTGTVGLSPNHLGANALRFRDSSEAVPAQVFEWRAV